MQFDFFDVPSPCVGICTTDERGYCQGCFRSRDERFDWHSFDVAQKQKVIKLCLQRKKRKQAKQDAVAVEVIESSATNQQGSLFDKPKPSNKVSESQDLDFKDFEL